MTIAEAIEKLRYIRNSLKNIAENEAIINTLESELTAETIPVFTKTIHLVISYDTGANALAAVDAIKTRVQGGDTSGDAVNVDYAYNFYLE
jgi:hypothetical protein